jgi:4-hydroxybenzoate polyprenyltransferase
MIQLFQIPAFLLFFYFVKTNSFDYAKPFQYKQKTTLFLQKPPLIHTSNISHIEFNTHHTHWYKGALRLVRVNNFAPTLLLCFTGGWIMDPSFSHFIHSTSFLASTLDTVFIMFASMAINDIYDVKIDKINNPTRPLITGELQVKDALFIVLLLLGATEYITLQYLPGNLQVIIQCIILQIILYTPVLKKIPIIKNISCATLVAFSIFFAGLSTSASVDKIMTTNTHFGLLSIAMSFVFFGSWANEILLDIRDAEGDKENNIKTLATLFGKPFSWSFTNGVFYFNLFFNTLSLSYLYNEPNVSLLPIGVFLSLLYKVNNIRQNDYSEESIVQYMNYSNYPLFILLLYFCVLSNFY